MTEAHAGIICAEVLVQPVESIPGGGYDHIHKVRQRGHPDARLCDCVYNSARDEDHGDEVHLDRS